MLSVRTRDVRLHADGERNNPSSFYVEKLVASRRAGGGVGFTLSSAAFGPGEGAGAATVAAGSWAHIHARPNFRKVSAGLYTCTW